MRRGGPATIRGILYQVLGTVDRALAYRLAATGTAEDEVEHALLIAEPRGGGDLEIHGESIAVEQWKSRSGGGPWSLRELAGDVLPDLVTAALENDLPPETRFAFVTEGRAGRWGEATSFFNRVRVAQQVQDWRDLDSVSSITAMLRLS